MDEMNALRQGLMDTCPGMELRENEPMERHTTFRIGGPARLMALPKTREEAAAAVRVARAHGIVHSEIARPSSWATAAICWYRKGISRLHHQGGGGGSPTLR